MVLEMIRSKRISQSSNFSMNQQEQLNSKNEDSQMTQME